MATTDGSRDLCDACYYGDIERVLTLVGEDADVNALVRHWRPPADATDTGGHASNEVIESAKSDLKRRNSVTPLYIASCCGHPDVVVALLHAGANFDLASNDGATPLFVAAKHGHIDVVAVLLDAGASVDVARKYGKHPLAAKGGHKEVVAVLLEAGASVDAASNRGTPLYAAAESGHTDVVAALLEAGASVNVASMSGGTPLFAAAEGGHADVVTVLIQAGASVDAANHVGETTMYAAAKGGHTEVVAVLLEAGASVDGPNERGATPLYAATEWGRTDVVAALLEAGASIDVADWRGVTPLHAAARGGHIDVVTALLEAGASVDDSNRDGENALYVAAERGAVDVVAALLEAGASVDVVTRDGKTPLYAATKRGYANVGTALLSAGASVNVRDNDGTTPLYIAASHGRVGAVVVLLESGANVDLAKSNGEDTPLFAAAAKDYIDVVEPLLRADADIDLANNLGQTPLAIAIKKNHASIQDTLRSAGALVNGHTREREPSIVVAVRNGALSVLQACLEADDKPDGEAFQKALWWAVGCGRVNCLRMLCHAMQSHEGYEFKLPPLVCLAAHLGYLEAIEVLVNENADLIQATEIATGLTALDFAVAARRDGVAEWLRARGAAPSQSGSTTNSVESSAAVSGTNSQATYETTIQRTANLASASVPFGGCNGSALLNVENVAGTAPPSSSATLHSSPTVDDARTLHTFIATQASAGSADESGGGAFHAAVTTAVERLLARLRTHSNGFVFSHILPTGDVGEGAYGKVHRGHFSGRGVAFKLQKNFDTNNVSADDVTQLMEFEHEARILSVLSEPTHRHCVGFLGVAVSPDVGIAVVTEYISGGDLRGWLHEHHHFDAGYGLAFSAGLASGLVFLHEAGVVHGDIKPENILLEYEEGGCGKVYGKWIDLGGGYPYWRGQTARTPRYASPEQLQHLPTEAGSDIFSFALVVVEVLSGERPPKPCSSPPIQREESARSTSSPPTESNRGGRAAEVCELWQQLPAQLSSCEALIELLVGCWDDYLYSRPRTSVVFETFVDVLTSFDPECAVTLTQQLEEAAPPPSGNSPLLTAVQYYDIEEVKRLVAEGARADEQNRWGHTPLHVAAAIDNATILGALLSIKPEPELKKDNFGNTPLDIAYEQSVMFGCCADTLATLREAYLECDLVTGGVEVEAFPLQDAVARQDVGAVRLLLQGGVDVNATNGMGETALHVAARMEASQLVAVLVGHGADVNLVENKDARSPLHLAAESGDVEVVRLLLQADTAVDMTDRRLQTALMISSEFGHADVVRALLDGGARVKLTTFYYGGSTALMFASANGHCDIVAILLDSGAKIDEMDARGQTALIRASVNGQTDVVAAVLDRGASVNHTDENGWTALMFACKEGHFDVVRILLGAGADIKVSGRVLRRYDPLTYRHVSALDVAREAGHNEIVALLESHAATVEAASPATAVNDNPS